jgi:hypothetical protein
VGTNDLSHTNVAAMGMALSRQVKKIDAQIMRVDLHSPSVEMFDHVDSHSHTTPNTGSSYTDIGAPLLPHSQETSQEQSLVSHHSHQTGEVSHIAHDNSSLMRLMSTSTETANANHNQIITSNNGSNGNVTAGVREESSVGSYQSFGMKTPQYGDEHVEFPPWNPSSGMALPPLPKIQADIQDFKHRLEILTPMAQQLNTTYSINPAVKAAGSLTTSAQNRQNAESHQGHGHRLHTFSYIKSCEGPTKDSCWVIPGRLAMGPKLIDHSKGSGLKKSELTSQALMLIAGFSGYVSLMTEEEEAAMERLYDIKPLQDTMKNAYKEAKSACNNLFIEAKTVMYEENELLKTLPSLSKSHHDYEAVHQRRVRALGRIKRGEDNIMEAKERLTAVPKRFDWIRIPVDKEKGQTLTIHEVLPHLWELERRLAMGERLYIYSDDGHSRVGTFCGALLGRLYALTPYECLYRIQACHDSAKREQARAVSIHCPQLPAERALITEVITLTNRVYQGLTYRSQSDPETYADERHLLISGTLPVYGRFPPLDPTGPVDRLKPPVYLDAKIRNNPYLQETIAEAGKQSAESTAIAILHRQGLSAHAAAASTTKTVDTSNFVTRSLNRTLNVGSPGAFSVIGLTSSSSKAGMASMRAGASSIKSASSSISALPNVAMTTVVASNASNTSTRAVARQSLSAKLGKELTSNSVWIKPISSRTAGSGSPDSSPSPQDTQRNSGLLSLALDGMGGGSSSNPGTSRSKGRRRSGAGLQSMPHTGRTIKTVHEHPSDHSMGSLGSEDDASIDTVDKDAGLSSAGMSKEDLNKYFDERFVRHARDLIKLVEKKRFAPAKTANNIPLNMQK